jgi:hypothetical protein
LQAAHCSCHCSSVRVPPFKWLGGLCTGIVLRAWDRVRHVYREQGALCVVRGMQQVAPPCMLALRLEVGATVKLYRMARRASAGWRRRAAPRAPERRPTGQIYGARVQYSVVGRCIVLAEGECIAMYNVYAVYCCITAVYSNMYSDV